MIVYSLVSDASIGYLFLAGVLPGLLMGLVQAAIVIVSARKRHFPVEKPVPLRELPKVTLEALPALMMPIVLLGGIYGGATTPTEAAAIAALYALLISAFFYRSINLRTTYDALLTSAKTTTSIGMLIAGALVFNYVVTVENIPAALSTWLAGFEMSPVQFLLVVNIVLLVLGCLLEGTTILLIVVPVFIPTANALGIDLVHFGVVCVVNIMLGLITPPYGLLLFVMSNISGSSLGRIVREILPFLIALLIALAIITLVPDLSLWLPRQLGYQG